MRVTASDCPPGSSSACCRRGREPRRDRHRHRDRRPGRRGARGLDGLPLVVDLLADGATAGTVEHDVVVDADGQHLLVPRQAVLLARTATPARLTAPGSDVVVLLPSAGALFAGKVGNLDLAHRPVENPRSSRR